MKLFNPLASGKASGRAYGGVFSFNRGLATFKKYVIPRIQNTALQLVRKNRFSYLQKYWEKNLTFEQCELWREWSLPWWDSYGHEVILTGINKFFKCNEILNEANKPLTNTPPTATPSEITASDTSSADVVCVEIAGIPNSEITAQSDFLRIEILGDLQSISYATGVLQIKVIGISVSRTPLEKNWTAVYWYNCRPNFEDITELVILLDTNSNPSTLQGLRVQRMNKYGFWSGICTYLHPLTIKNLVINGHFVADFGWELGSNTSIHDGKVYYTSGGYCRQHISGLIIGKTYQIDFDNVFSGGSGTIFCYFDNADLGHADATRHYTFTRVYTGSTDLMNFSAIQTYQGNIDNVVIKEL